MSRHGVSAWRGLAGAAAIAFGLFGACVKTPTPVMDVATETVRTGRCANEGILPFADVPAPYRRCDSVIHEAPAGSTVVECWEGKDDGVAIVRLPPGAEQSLTWEPQGQAPLIVNPTLHGSEAKTYQHPGWALDRIDQRDASGDDSFSIANGGEGTRIWVVDSGVADNLEFKGRLRPKVGIHECSTEAPCSPHGTHVASLAAGTTHGVARQAAIIPVDVLDEKDEACTADLVRAFRAIGGALGPRDVVNVSIELDEPCAQEGMAPICRQLDRELDRLTALAVVVVAAGNEDRGTDKFALSRNVGAVVVGGISALDEPLFRDGPTLDLLAPADDVAVITPAGEEAAATGTSLAAPLVAGVAAVAWAADPAIQSPEVAAEITDWASPVRMMRIGDHVYPDKVLCARIGGNCPSPASH